MQDYGKPGVKNPQADLEQKLGYQISDTLRVVSSQIEAAHFQAKVLVDDYWLKWRSSNRALRTEGGTFTGGEIAPRACIKSDKIYLIWTRYRPGRVGNVGKSWGDDIKPTGRGYTVEQLTRKSPDWERRMIEQTETRLAPLREVLDCLHDAKVKLRRIERKQS